MKATTKTGHALLEIQLRPELRVKTTHLHRQIRRNPSELNRARFTLSRDNNPSFLDITSKSVDLLISAKGLPAQHATSS